MTPRLWEEEIATDVKFKVKVVQFIWLFVTPWNIQSMEFSRPEYYSGYPFPSPGDLPNPGIEPRSPALQVDSLLAEPQKRYLNSQLEDTGKAAQLNCTEKTAQFARPGKVWTGYLGKLTWFLSLIGCFGFIGIKVKITWELLAPKIESKCFSQLVTAFSGFPTP